jgi:hypothetical protein
MNEKLDVFLMAHKRKPTTEKQAAPYTVEDAMKITEEIFNLSKEKNYHPGAFVHGLIFALEFTQMSYQIPPQQIAMIKRDCRRYFKEMEGMKKP